MAILNHNLVSSLCQKKTLGVIETPTILLHALEKLSAYISLFLFVVLRSVSYCMSISRFMVKIALVTNTVT